MFKRQTILPVLIIMTFVLVPVMASAMTKDEIQQQIQSLFVQVQALQAQLAAISDHGSSNISSSETGASTSCLDLSRTLSLGMSGSDVTKLQSFLANAGYFNDSSTGYFGPITEAAMQKWQVAHGVVSSGDAVSTGYGVVGPRTRAAILASCHTITASSSITPSSGVTSPTADTVENSSSDTSCVAYKTSYPDGSTTSCTVKPGPGVGCPIGLPFSTWQCTNGTWVTNPQTTSPSNSSAQSCTFNDQSMKNGNSVTAYQSSSAAYGSQCASQTRTCSNGTLSGSYQYASCSVASAPTTSSSGGSCTLYDGTTHANGSTITACALGVGGAPSGCPAGLIMTTPQPTFVCSNGTWVQQTTQTTPNNSCTLGGTTYSNRQSMSYTTYCQAIGSCNIIAGETLPTSVTCTNGQWQTLYPSSSSQSCSFNGQSIASGNSVTAYQSSSAAYGSQCASQTRTCSNGTLSGNYQYASCSVSSNTTSGTGGSCTTPASGVTYANGTTIPFSATDWNICTPAHPCPITTLHIPTSVTCTNGTWVEK